MIISRTPFRISFFGGGTDYPVWYRKNGGQVLAATIDKYCYLTCRYLPPFFEHRISVAYSKIETCQTVDEISHPAVREILRYLKVERGVAIKHDSDLPARSGMGSSSAFTVGLLHALHALQGHIPTRQELASEGIHLEQEILKETVGSQDQVLAAVGGFNHLAFHQSGEITIRPMTLPPERLRELNAQLMLFYTGISRTASAVAASFVPDIASREVELKTISRTVDDGLKVLREGRDIREFGALLHQTWLAKQGLGRAVSNPEVAEIYAQARAAGAVGGKLIGAGGGGFMLLFVPPAARGAVRARLRRLIHVPFKFEHAGSQVIFYDPGEDYSAEERRRAEETIAPFRELADLPLSEA